MAGPWDYFLAGAKDFVSDVRDAASGNMHGPNFTERERLFAQNDQPPAPQQGQSPPSNNFAAATAALKLTPQEQALYQLHLKHLWGPGGVDNPDGSRSTLYQTSFESNGRTYNVPTVYDGKIIPPHEAINRAMASGLPQFPSYANEQEAESRYQQMHGFMEKDTQTYMQQRKAAPTAQAAAAADPSFSEPRQTTTRLGTMGPN